MSTLLNRLKTDQITARKAKAAHEVTFLSLLIGEASAFATSGKERRDVTDEDVVKASTKMIKSLTETRGLARDEDARSSLDFELAVAQRYVPAQMSEDALRKAIEDIVAANAGANKGLVMKSLRSAHGTAYDGRAAALLVDQILAS